MYMAFTLTMKEWEQCPSRGEVMGTPTMYTVGGGGGVWSAEDHNLLICHQPQKVNRNNYLLKGWRC